MKFTKMHGLGNDYVYVNGFEEHVADPGELAKKVSDRHYGIGADGVIMILPPTGTDKADVRMREFNIDGSEGDMCGNGIRCVAKYSFDHGLTKNNPMRVETRARHPGRAANTRKPLGMRMARSNCVTVNMGERAKALSRRRFHLDPTEGGNARKRRWRIATRSPANRWSLCRC